MPAFLHMPTRRPAITREFAVRLLLPGLLAFGLAMEPLGLQGMLHAAPLPVRLTRLDGSIDTAGWLGCQNDGTIEVQMESSRRRLSWFDLLSVSFREGEHIAPKTSVARFFPPAGGFFYGTMVEARRDAVLVESAFAHRLALSFDKLTGIALTDSKQYVRSSALFDKALAQRQPGSDVLITRSTDNAKMLRGRLIELGPQGGTFEFAGRVRSISLQKIFGVVFASGVERDIKLASNVELVDGSHFAASLIECGEEYFELDTTFAGRLRVPADLLHTVSVNSPRLAYLSDMHPIDRRSQGMLYGEWPVQLDKSVVGRELAIDGRVFRKGLGVHSLSEIDYDLASAFEMFVAVIGIDDEVRPRGDVVFQVLGDGVVLFDSGAVTGRESARDVRVDVSGVNIMTLRVDFGEGLDLADHADWAEARLLRPAQSTLPHTRAQ